MFFPSLYSSFSLPPPEMENAKTLHAIIETNKNKLKTIKFTFIESYPENGSLRTYDVMAVFTYN